MVQQMKTGTPKRWKMGNRTLILLVILLTTIAFFLFIYPVGTGVGQWNLNRTIGWGTDKGKR